MWWARWTDLLFQSNFNNFQKPGGLISHFTEYISRDMCYLRSTRVQQMVWDLRIQRSLLEVVAISLLPGQHLQEEADMLWSRLHSAAAYLIVYLPRISKTAWLNLAVLPAWSMSCVSWPCNYFVHRSGRGAHACYSLQGQ